MWYAIWNWSYQFYRRQNREVCSTPDARGLRYELKFGWFPVSLYKRNKTNKRTTHETVHEWTGVRKKLYLQCAFLKIQIYFSTVRGLFKISIFMLRLYREFDFRLLLAQQPHAYGVLINLKSSDSSWFTDRRCLPRRKRSIRQGDEQHGLDAFKTVSAVSNHARACLRPFAMFPLFSSIRQCRKPLWNYLQNPRKTARKLRSLYVPQNPDYLLVVKITATAMDNGWKFTR